MKEEYKQWISEHEVVFLAAMNVTPETRRYVYDIYNDTFNKKRKMTGCFRCWKVVRDEVYNKYKESNGETE